MQNKAKTTTSQLTKLFVSLFVAILVLVNIAFLVISSGYIYYNAKSQSEQVITAVEDFNYAAGPNLLFWRCTRDF